MVTVELAAGLPVVVLVLGVVLSALVAGVDQLRVTDAARVAARSAARGDATEQVVAVVRHDAPPGASVALTTDASDVTVTVRAPARGALRWVFGGWQPHATVIVPREQLSNSGGAAP